MERVIVIETCPDSTSISIRISSVDTRLDPALTRDGDAHAHGCILNNRSMLIWPRSDLSLDQYRPSNDHHHPGHGRLQSESAEFISYS